MHDYRTLLSWALNCGPGAVQQLDAMRCRALEERWTMVMNGLAQESRPHDLTIREAALIAAIVAEEVASRQKGGP